ncbi:ABC transporter substrate-binding protein [Streptomyces sp. 7N604]|uniref:ABC transporter substrate-binding protein n=1 Tax=Streptomyces sp. 7N604 TaxID=3457415 RepID=UPI003FD16C39
MTPRSPATHPRRPNSRPPGGRASVATTPVAETGTPTPLQQLGGEVTDNHKTMAPASTPLTFGGRSTSLTRRHLLSGITAACAASLVGCSETTEGNEPRARAGAQEGLRYGSVAIGVMPIVDCAPLHLAVRDGFFRAEGLEVSTETIVGGTAGIPRLEDDLDITFGNYVSFIQAQDTGRDLRIVSDGYQATGGTIALMVARGTTMRSPADLKGRTVAVNVRHNVAHLATVSLLSTHRVDEDEVSFVELPFPDMADALEKGRVDAAVMVDPFITSAQRALEAEQLGDATSGPTENLPIAGYASTTSWAKGNPGTVAAFTRAMKRAQQACADPAVVTAILPTYTEIDKRTASFVNVGAFPASTNPIRIQRVADLMLRFGVLSRRFDVTVMFG